MPLKVVNATDAQMVAVLTLAKGFEQESAHILVDVDYCIKTYRSFLLSGIGGMLVLLQDDIPIGGLGYIIAPDLHMNRQMAIETFWFVLPSQRGGGLLLLAEFEKIAEKSGCSNIAMIHLSDSHPEALEKLYLRRGYKLVEKHYVKEIHP